MACSRGGEHPFRLPRGVTSPRTEGGGGGIHHSSPQKKKKKKKKKKRGGGGGGSGREGGETSMRQQRRRRGRRREETRGEDHTGVGSEREAHTHAWTPFRVGVVAGCCLCLSVAAEY